MNRCIHLHFSKRICPFHVLHHLWTNLHICFHSGTCACRSHFSWDLSMHRLINPVQARSIVFIPLRSPWLPALRSPFKNLGDSLPHFLRVAHRQSQLSYQQAWPSLFLLLQPLHLKSAVQSAWSLDPTPSWYSLHRKHIGLVHLLFSWLSKAQLMSRATFFTDSLFPGIESLHSSALMRFAS
jgi:hypothetical protein